MADNRTHFVVDAQQFINTDEVFLTWESFKVLAHMQDAGDLQVPAFYQWNEDGVLADFQFSVDNTKNVSIDNLAIALVISDGTTTVELDRIEINLSPNAGDPPVINTNDLRGYQLPVASEFNLVQITDGGTVATKTFYDGVVGQKITWQEWIANANIPATFIDITQDNDGLNQKADNYSNVSGYQVYLKGIAQVTGDDSVQGRVSRSYEVLSPTVTVYNYDESNDGEIVSGTIETFDSTDTYNLNGGIIPEEDTIFKCTWVGLSPLAIADLGYVIHRIERENAPGNLEIEEISSFRGAVAGGKLSNIQAVQSGNDIVSSCIINANSITNGNWKLSARIQIPAYPILITVSSTYTGGYVLIEDLTAVTSVSSVTGSAVLSTEIGNSIRVTLSDDDTQDPGNDVLLWSAVGLPSTPQDGGTWSITAQEYPYGMTVGDQIFTEKQITFTVTQSNTIDAGFRNRLTWSCVKYLSFSGVSNSRIEAILAIDDGIGDTFTAATKSGVLDTNPPANSYASATDLTGRDGSILDHIQTTPAKANQLLQQTTGAGIEYADSINSTTNGLLQTQLTNTGQFLYDRLLADGLGLFGVPTAASAAQNGTADSTGLRYTFVLFKPTDLNFAPAANRPIVDGGTFNVGAGASVLYHGAFETSYLSSLDEDSGVGKLTKPFTDEAHLAINWAVASTGTPYANAVAYTTHFENTTNGVIQADNENGGGTWTDVNLDMTQDLSCIGQDGRFHLTSNAAASGTCGIFEFSQWIRAWKTPQMDWMRDRKKEDYSI